MKWSALALVMLASPVVAEQHLAELRQSILSCESRDCVGEAASFCMDNTEGGQSTFGMQNCLIQEMQIWDELLNEAYGDARATAKSLDAADLETFPEYAVRETQVRDAQRAWITYRDANCAMDYGLWGSGSMRVIWGAECLLRMTAERTFELRIYADGLK
ncbi:Protein of unknown function [Cognatiyoonia sediminum]|uniref:Lysozyme inhibitor LprI-like N-terminal domain-containing protein n=1 Tax=Cognatiyoonia sediminum TaxID=1508389 RepID=A0A1M5MUK2_9RHOB|nr:lysozyme inhibitor LprI family protein [Cognatiyoonia sediminum]SHG80847.1 Protein of unknown function [Cognatiyoonia sediminum]